MGVTRSGSLKSAVLGSVVAAAALLVSGLAAAPASATTNIVLSGRVVSEAGTPISGVIVQELHHTSRVTSAADGTFALVTPLQTHELVLDRANLEVRGASFAATASTNLGDLTFPDTRAVDIAVTDEDGHALPGAADLTSTSASWPGADWLVADHPLSPTMSAAAASYTLSSRTTASGTAHLVVPVQAGGSLPDVAITYAVGTNDYAASLADDAVQTATDTYAVAISGLHLAAPGAPTIWQAGQYVHGGEFQGLKVEWTAPVSDGHNRPTQYVVTASPGGATKTAADPGVGVLFTDLPRGQSYTFTVTAVNAAGSSPASAASDPVRMPWLAPSAPLNPTATLHGDDATVQWSPPADDGGGAIQSYVVSACDMSQGSCASQTVTGTVAVFDDLRRLAQFTFLVRASNVDATGEAAVTDAVFVPAAPERPGRPQVRLHGRQVTVTWKAPAANGAAIKRYLVTVGAKKVWVEGSKRRVSLTLAPGRYQVRVLATNAVGRSQPSPAASVAVRRP